MKIFLYDEHVDADVLLREFMEAVYNKEMLLYWADADHIYAITKVIMRTQRYPLACATKPLRALDKVRVRRLLLNHQADIDSLRHAVIRVQGAGKLLLYG